MLHKLNNTSTDQFEHILSVLPTNGIESIISCLSVDDISKYFRENSESTMGTSKFEALLHFLRNSGNIEFKYYDIAKLLGSRSPEYIANHLVFLPYGTMDHFLASLPVIKRNDVLNILIVGENTRIYCTPNNTKASCSPGEETLLPAIDFSQQLHTLFVTATQQQIESMQLGKYDSNIIKKALEGVAPEKQKFILNKHNEEATKIGFDEKVHVYGLRTNP